MLCAVLVISCSYKLDISCEIAFRARTARVSRLAFRARTARVPRLAFRARTARTPRLAFRARTARAPRLAPDQIRFARPPLRSRAPSI